MKEYEITKVIEKNRDIIQLVASTRKLPFNKIEEALRQYLREQKKIPFFIPVKEVLRKFKFYGSEGGGHASPPRKATRPRRLIDRE